MLTSLHQKVEALASNPLYVAQLVKQWTSDPEMRFKVGVQAQVRTIGIWHKKKLKKNLEG